MTNEWQPIATAPKDGSEVLVLSVIATVPLVRNAWWNNGALWQEWNFPNREEAIGWWFSQNSVGQDRMEGMYEPTHWMPMPFPPAPEPTP